MSITQFSVTTGSPQVIDVESRHQPNNPNGVMGVQNDGAVELTVNGKLIGNSNWALLGTVPANSINGIAFIPGLVQIQLDASEAEGTVVL